MRQAIQELVGAEGDVDAWLRRILDELPQSFERACERWRTLYNTALATSIRQGAAVVEASRPPEERERAKRLRAEAEEQIKQLQRAEGSGQQGDFYRYRYFAAEGILPGYNFPRLPLSAWLPGRRRKSGKDEYLQRPRFLAISEFGPNAIVYHEGSKFVIEKAMLSMPVASYQWRSARTIAPVRKRIAANPLRLRHRPGP